MPFLEYISFTTAISCFKAGFAYHYVLIDSNGCSNGNPIIPRAIPTPALIRRILKSIHFFEASFGYEFVFPLILSR